jgi:hypothetical protein
MKRGLSAESPKPSRSLLIAVLRLLSKSTKVSCGQIHNYPRGGVFHFNQAVTSSFLGQYETSLKEYREASRLAPYNSFFARGVIFTDLLSNRVEEAAVAVREAQIKRVDSHLAHVRYQIAFYRGDSAEMARQVASASGTPWEEDLLLALDADTAAYFGRLHEAREFSRRAADSAERTGEKEVAATYRAVSAFREALFGNSAVAGQGTTNAHKGSSGRDLDYAIALASAYAGSAKNTRTLADDLGKRFPEDTIVQLNYLPALRAKLAVLKGNPLEALHSLEAAAPYELGLPAMGFYNWANLYPVYVRGEAYLAAHQGREAAVEFQKILDHRGIVLNETIRSPPPLPNLKKQKTFLEPSQHLIAESAIGLNRARSRAPQQRLFAIEERRAHTAQAESVSMPSAGEGAGDCDPGGRLRGDGGL